MNGLHALHIGYRAAIYVQYLSNQRNTVIGDQNRNHHIQIIERGMNPPPLGTYDRAQWQPWAQEYERLPGQNRVEARDARYALCVPKTRAQGWHIQDFYRYYIPEREPNPQPRLLQVCENCLAAATQQGFTPQYIQAVTAQDPWWIEGNLIPWDQRSNLVDPVSGL